MFNRAVLVVFIFLLLGSIAYGQSPFTAEFAFRTLYGNYDAKTKTAVWKDFRPPTDPAQQDRFICETETEPLQVRVLLDKATVEDGAEKHYFITWAGPISREHWSARPCGVVVGASVFVMRNGNWEIESSNRHMTPAGTYGYPPNKVRFVNFGPHKHGIIMETYDMTQGYHGAGSKLIAPVGSEFKELLFENIYSDNSGRCPDDEPCFRSVVDISLVATPQAEYPDIRMVSHGTSLDSEHNIVPENWIKLLRFRDGKYQLLTKTTLPARKRGIQDALRQPRTK